MALVQNHSGENKTTKDRGTFLFLILPYRPHSKSGPRISLQWIHPTAPRIMVQKE